jgi:uncharacterized membrane protein
MEDKKIPTTIFHRIIETLCLLFIAGTFIFMTVYWDKIPDKIPTHFNVMGKIDSWGSKNGIIACPIVMTVIYALITLIGNFPQIWNTGVKITENNRDFIYLNLKNMLVTMKFSVILIFSAITFFQAQSKELPVWYLAAVLILLFGSMAFYIVRIFRYK